MKLELADLEYEEEVTLEKTTSLHDTVLERVNSTKLKKTVRAINSYALKNLKHSLRYPMSWLYWMLVPLLWVIPYAFQGEALTDGGTSGFFEQYGGTGDYLSYVAIGIILFNIVDAAIWGSGNQLRWEQKNINTYRATSFPIIVVLHCIDSPMSPKCMGLSYFQ